MNLEELQKELVRFEVFYKELLDVLAVKQMVLDDYIASYYALEKKTDWNCIALNNEFPEAEEGEDRIFVDVYIEFPNRGNVDVATFYPRTKQFILQRGEYEYDRTDYVTHWKYRPKPPVVF